MTPVAAPPHASTDPASGRWMPAPLGWRGGVGWSLAAVASFHLAYEVPGARGLIAVFLLSLLKLARVEPPRLAVYLGLAVGMGIYGPQLPFFWTIFQAPAVVLWLILAAWLAMYLLLQRFAWQRLGEVWGTLCAPVLWMAQEYVRSELYYLKFSWLNVGYLFPSLSGVTGMYGVGFVLMLAAAVYVLSVNHRKWRQAGNIATKVIVILVFVTAFLNAVGEPVKPPPGLAVAGVQLEWPSDQTIIQRLDDLYAAHPDTQLFVLSEYSFVEPVPKEVKAWCARRQRWLIAGGEKFIGARFGPYRNTAFVIGPDGNEVFSQAKSVPIQLFRDGLPAERQAVWNSPWGKIGLCICYDLSYTRVTDELIRQGAQIIIVPTMDVIEWGEREHRLHSRVAPTRAAEYGVPIFRLCSSGISQAVSGRGEVLASAPYPGQGSTLAARLNLPARGHLPIDRMLVWPCMAFALLLLGWQCVSVLAGWRRAISTRRRAYPSSEESAVHSSAV